MWKAHVVAALLLVTHSMVGLSIHDAKEVVYARGPVMKFSKGEKYFPSSFPWYFIQCMLRDKNGNILLKQGQVTSREIARHNTSDYHLDPNGSQTAYRGRSLTKDGRVIAPCYVNYLLKDDRRAVMQIFFFYPFNGSPPGQGGKKTAGHEGDVEEVDFHLIQDGNDVRIERALYFRHGRSHEWVEGNRLEYDNDGHPKVYCAHSGHASYHFALKKIDKKHNNDIADGKGLVWLCFKYAQIINWQNPPRGQEHVNSNIRTGVTNDMNRRSKGFHEAPPWLGYRIYRNPPKPVFITKVHCTFGEKTHFNLESSVRDRILMWEIEHPKASGIECEVKQPAKLKKAKEFFKDPGLLFKKEGYQDTTILRVRGKKTTTRRMSFKDYYIEPKKGLKKGSKFTVVVYGIRE